MEEARKAIVKRVQINGVPYLKDNRHFLYKELKKKKKGPAGTIVGIVVNYDDKPFVLKKRVNVNYISKSGKHIEVCTSLDTLDDLFTVFKKTADKSLLGKLYKSDLEVIKQIEVIEEPTVFEAARLMMAVREVTVICSLLTDQPLLNISPITCSVCKKTDFDSTFKKCGGCKSVYFCSSECNKLAWAEHKKHCKEIMCYEKWL